MHRIFYFPTKMGQIHFHDKLFLQPVSGNVETVDITIRSNKCPYFSNNIEQNTDLPEVDQPAQIERAGF